MAIELHIYSFGQGWLSCLTHLHRGGFFFSHVWFVIDELFGWYCFYGGDSGASGGVRLRRDGDVLFLLRDCVGLRRVRRMRSEVGFYDGIQLFDAVLVLFCILYCLCTVHILRNSYYHWAIR